MIGLKFCIPRRWSEVSRLLNCKVVGLFLHDYVNVVHLCEFEVVSNGMFFFMFCKLYLCICVSSKVWPRDGPF